MKLNRSTSIIAAMVTVGATFAAPAASALTVGPGSPIRMPEKDAVVEDGRHVRTGMCSTGVAGTACRGGVAVTGWAVVPGSAWASWTPNTIAAVNESRRGHILKQ